MNLTERIEAFILSNIAPPDQRKATKASNGFRILCFLWPSYDILEGQTSLTI